MEVSLNQELTRRNVLLASAALSLAAGSAKAADKEKIGIIGAGNIGGVMGQMLAAAGYPVMLTARDLGPVKALAAKIGHGALAGTVEEAANFGPIIVMAVP